MLTGVGWKRIQLASTAAVMVLSSQIIYRADAWARKAFPGSFPAQGYVFDYRPDINSAAWVPFAGHGAAIRC